MPLRSLLRIALVSVLALAVSSCGGAAEEEISDDELEVVPDGKADDYFSDVSAEFEVSGTVRVKLDRAGDAEHRKDKIGRRLTAVSLFMTAYLTNKLENFFQNGTYGGFSAMARNHTVAAADVKTISETELDVKFTIDVAGPKTLMRAIPKLDGSTAGVTRFELAMIKDYESDPNSVERGQIRNFDPAKYTGAMDKVVCEMKPEKAANDAYPDFKGLLGDGTLDLTMYYGHDYNTPRSDLSESKDAFFELKQLGFTAPAANWDALTATSGPFTKTIKANGKDVKVEVRIFHGDMFKSDRRKGHDTALTELAARDVFFYNGHAGPYYGLYLSDDKPNDVKYSELSTYPLPAKQQIFIAQGCQTYSQYADVLFANPAKDEKNLDVITTVNFSYGLGTLDILRFFVQTDGQKVHQPQTYAQIIRALNSEYWNQEKEVFYGVHGIDANPRVHPYANLAKIGTACTTATQCGDVGANVCVKKPGATRKTCGGKALDKATCPTGTKLYALASQSSIKTYACLK